ncbi:MAG: Gfo/Idh/MocA family protein [Planctomycetota bacterium]
MKTYKKAKDIRVGVVGYGGAYNMGKAHLTQMNAAGMTPAAVADTDESRLAVAKEEFPGIATFNSVGRMLGNSDVDLVVLITPHNTHAKLALKCLKAGRHVVCEKPLAITTAECDRMIREAGKQNRMLSTYHNRHWDGCVVEALKQIRDRGRIGEIVRIDAHMTGYGQPRDWWRSSKSISGGILYDWGVHFLEYALQLVDSSIVEVSGFAHTGFWAPKVAWKDDTNEDEASAIIRFTSGAWMTLTMSQIDAASRCPDRKWFEITGTKGTYFFDGKGWKIVLPKKNKTVVEEGSNPPNAWQNYYNNIAAYLTGKEDLVISADWSRRPIHILDLAGRSAKQGKALKAKHR